MKCLGVLSACSPQLPAGILTLLQLEPPSSVFPGHGHLLEHLARGAFCGPLFLSGLLLSFLKLSICLSACVRSELQHMWESLLCPDFPLVAVHDLSCPGTYGILVSQPGIEPMSPALEGSFLTPGPPGKSRVLVAQLCPTLCDPMDCSPPGFSVHGILQAGIQECVAIPFSRGSSQPRH